MKTAVTLLVLGLVLISAPAFACGDKECEAKHRKGAKESSSVPTDKPLKEAAKVSDDKKAEAPIESQTKSEAK
jgi:hypothetical protein